MAGIRSLVVVVPFELGVTGATGITILIVLIWHAVELYDPSTDLLVNSINYIEFIS